MHEIDRIEVNPEVMLGKPVIKGTRIPVYIILDLLSQGNSVDDILTFYPYIQKEDIFACLKFSSHSLEKIELYEAVC